MDIKDRIRQLMDERGWSIYELARRSGLSQTTLSNMWKRNTEPSIASLRAICDAFGITLSQFFSNSITIELTPEQADDLARWRRLTPEQRQAVINLVSAFGAREADKA